MMDVFFGGRPTSPTSPTSLTSLTCPTRLTCRVCLACLTCWACLTGWVGGGLGALLVFFEGGFILGGMGKRRRTGRRSV